MQVVPSKRLGDATLEANVTTSLAWGLVYSSLVALPSLPPRYLDMYCGSRAHWTKVGVLADKGSGGVWCTSSQTYASKMAPLHVYHGYQCTNA